MDVGAFAANINSFNGLHSPNKFRVRVYPKFGADVRFMEFLCDTVTLPGATVSTSSSRPLGYGPLFFAPTTTVYDPVNASFLVDNTGMVLDQITSWQQRVVNHMYEPGGALDNSFGSEPFLVGYVDEYAARVEIETYTQSAEVLSTYTLHDAWPSSVGAIQLAWSNKDQYSVLPVTFTYRSWTSTHMSQEDL